MLNPYQLLEKYNLSFDDLNAAERETLTKWADALKTKTLTLQNVKEYIDNCVIALGRQLADLDQPDNLWQWLTRKKRMVYVQARLKNYLMLQDFLTAPERAQKW